MNLAYYGDQAYGVEAAAQHYFGVPASKLNLVAGRTARRPRRRTPARPTRCTSPTQGAGPAQRRPRPDARAWASSRTRTTTAAKVRTPIAKMLKVTQPAAAACASAGQPYFCRHVMAYLLTEPRHGGAGQDRAGARSRTSPTAA